MQVKAQKWGNSLAIRLPRALTRDANIQENQVLEARASRGQLIIEPRKHPTLDELLAKLPDDYRESELSTGAPVGKEVW